MILAICWIVTILSAIFLGLRVYAKLSRHVGLWWDDYILIVSWVLVLNQSISTTVWVSYGYGKPFQDINPENLPNLRLLGEIVPSFSFAAASLSKTGFAIMLLRLAKPWIKKLIWFLIMSMNIISFLAVLFVWIACTPVRKGWYPEIEGTCWDGHAMMIHVMVAAGYSGFLDFALSLMPLFLLWNVQVKRREKIGIIIAMSMGFFAGVTTIIKTVYLPQGWSDGYVSNKSAQITIWGTIEPTVTIIAASIPVLRVFLKEHVSSMSRFYGSGGRKENHYSTIQDGTTVTIKGGGGQTDISQQPDDRSDRGILGGQNIMQISEVSVEYTSRNDTDSMVYEMERMDRDLNGSVDRLNRTE
ncbi:hypothetical protein GQ44DRAFT_714051 [Phaeosphaeriaceae sp. PMI808]|nr:hypothetical protein GQ44DRAFT_714051 [Phaeosphaeriaceae sp. PMI808]